MLTIQTFIATLYYVTKTWTFWLNLTYSNSNPASTALILFSKNGCIGNSWKNINHYHPTAKPGPSQRVIRRELKTDSYSKGPTLFVLRCILCHNFWTIYDLALFSTLKWSSDLQFCETYKGRCRKMTRNCRKMIKQTGGLFTFVKT